MPTNDVNNALSIYGGVNRGGTQGAQGVLQGLSGISSNYTPLNPAATSLGSGANALGIYNGVERGGVLGYGGAALNATQLAGRAGLLPADYSKSIGSGANDLSSALGIYSGIQQGGVAGDTSAAVNAARLGSNLGVLPASVGTAAGYAAAPLALYNEIHNWQSGATGSDALSGAETGAAAGSVILPGVGTLIGGLIGGAAGAISSAFGNGRVDPENSSFEGYTQAYNKAAQQGQGSQVAQSVQNPYVALAGMFDLRSNQIKGSIPMYNQYGRMGEQKFVNDMTGQIDQALAAGTISKSDSAASIYSKAVAPWINSMGTWKDSNKDAMTALLTQMSGQYVNGQQGQWKAIGGDAPFAQPHSAASTPSIQALKGSTAHAAGGSVKRYYDDGGSVYDSGLSPDTVTITAPQSQDWNNLNFDPAAFSALNQQTVDPNSLQNPYGNFDPNSVSELPSAQQAVNAGSGFSLANLLKGTNGLAALGGLGAAALGGGSLNNTANFNPSPPGMFPNSGPQAQTGAYGNFSATPRTRLNPSVDYAHYGQGPEASFYSPSATPAANPAVSSPVPSQGPAAGAAPTLTPALLAQIQQYLQQQQVQPRMGIQNPHLGSMTRRASGGAVGHSPLLMGHMMGSSPYMTPATHGGPNHIRGPGNGTSDSIDAKLSDGEYVMDAGTVSMLGNGSNDAGARALDQLRHHIRKHAGTKLSQGEQFMKARQPQQYLGNKS